MDVARDPPMQSFTATRIPSGTLRPPSSRHQGHQHRRSHGVFWQHGLADQPGASKVMKRAPLVRECQSDSPWKEWRSDSSRSARSRQPSLVLECRSSARDNTADNLDVHLALQVRAMLDRGLECSTGITAQWQQVAGDLSWVRLGSSCVRLGGGFVIH